MWTAVVARSIPGMVLGAWLRRSRATVAAEIVTGVVVGIVTGTFRRKRNTFRTQHTSGQSIVLRVGFPGASGPQNNVGGFGHGGDSDLVLATKRSGDERCPACGRASPAPGFGPVHRARLHGGSVALLDDDPTVRRSD